MSLTNDAADENPLPPPPRILQLPSEVVNRIAAGEVVVSPAAALKELLENSIDAGATAITVSVRSGGAKLLQVTDNGRGILPADLPLLCERHATSKLRTFDELSDVATFGFRGEALASVSHVARVSVLTKTPGAKCAYSARYADGVMAAPAAPAAGLAGTALSVEDLFYNLPTRRRALRSASEEYRAIVDVVARYAIRYAGVAFVCKRLADGGGRGGSAGSLDVRTAAGARVEENIRAAFGANLAQELVDFEVRLEECGVAVRAHATNPGFSMRKGLFVLFINGRLVNCGPLKRAVDSSYAAFLPKGGHSFVYLDICMRACDVDVNVHPNKMEVRFLHEAQLIDAVVEALEARLKSDGKSRTFLAQALIAPSGNLTFPGRSKSGLASRPSQTQRMSGRPSSVETVPIESKPVDSAGGKVGTGGPRRVRSAKRIRAPPSTSLIDDEALVGNACANYDEDGMDVVPDAEMADFINDDDTEDSDVVPTTPVDDEDSSPPASIGIDALPSRVPTESPKAVGVAIPGSSSKLKIASKDKIRNSRVAPVGAMDAFVSHGSQPSVATDLRRRRERRHGALPMLTSIEELLGGLRSNAHRGALEILRQHTFVGVASDKYSLIQHQSKLMLVDTAPVVTELMYRQALMRFADLDSIKLNPPAPLVPLLALALEGSEAETPLPPAPASSAIAGAQFLLGYAPLLKEYFSIEINGASPDDAHVSRLPILFDGVVPNLVALPEFLTSLLDIDWTEERPCLDGIARALANWYGAEWKPEESTYNPGEAAKETEGSAQKSAAGKHLPSFEDRKEWLLRHVLFESMRFEFDPPHVLAAALREVTSTQKLYRVFERC